MAKFGANSKVTRYVVYADGIRCGSFGSAERAHVLIETWRLLPQGPKTGNHDYEIKTEIAESIPVYI